MRCVECSRLVERSAGQCPYCGSSVLTPARGDRLAAHARTLWDDTDPSNNVVPFPAPRDDGRVRDLSISAIGWLIGWGLGLVVSGFADFWEAWLAGWIAIACGTVVLFVLDAPPLWRVLVNRLSAPTDEHNDGEQPPVGVSNY